MVLFCTGWISRNRLCIFAPDGSGERVRNNTHAVCFLCDPDSLFHAMNSATGRGNVVRKLKLLRTNNIDIYHRAWSGFLKLNIGMNTQLVALHHHRHCKSSAYTNNTQQYIHQTLS